MDCARAAIREFLAPLGIIPTRLAQNLHVPAPRINAIVRGKRAITADTALRLGQYFKMEPQFWLNLQSNARDLPPRAATREEGDLV